MTLFSKSSACIHAAFGHGVTMQSTHQSLLLPCSVYKATSAGKSKPGRRSCHGPKKPILQTLSIVYSQSNDTLFLSQEQSSTVQRSFQELADSLVLPPDFLAQLPRDLRLDLNDAAFDLSSGPLREECGKELGDILMQLSQAWETADTEATAAIAKILPSLMGNLTEDTKFAVGKRLKSAGMRFASMGQYGQGELQRIARSMTSVGEALTIGSSQADIAKKPIDQTRTLKFGSLQVKLTSKKAYIGSGVALVFGALSWQLSAAVQSIPESSLQYANDNALLLAKSLRGALLTLCYSSTVLSAVTMGGLFLFGRQLSSEENKEE